MNNTNLQGVKKLFDQIPDPEMLPEHPFVSSMFAPTATGKTTAEIKLIETLQKRKEFDNIILISSSGYQDPDTGMILDTKYKYAIEKGLINEVHPKLNKETLQEIIAEQTHRLKAYKKYSNFREIYKMLLRETKMTPYQLNSMLREEGVEMLEVPEINGKKVDRFPQVLVIIDDPGTITGKFVGDFVSLCRHKNFSAIFCVQYLKMVTPAIRANQNFIVIFNTMDKKYLTQIYDETCSADMTLDTFLKYFESMDERHNCFVINTLQSDRGKRYGINFKFIEPPAKNATNSITCPKKTAPL